MYLILILNLLSVLVFCWFPEVPGYLSAQETVVQDPFQQALSQLTHKDPQVRRQGAETLGRIRNPAAIDALLKLLSDPVPAVRSAAVDALGLMRVFSASTQIAKLLETDKEPTVRQTCAIALGYIADRNTIPSLMKGIKDNHEGTRFACINSLGILRDGSAVETLVKELKNPDGRMRNACAYALGNISDKSAIPYLIDALKVARSTISVQESEKPINTALGITIVKSLALIGDSSVTPVLTHCLGDQDKKFKVNVAQALFRLGDSTGTFIARQLINDSDASCRKISAELLGELGNSKDLQMLKKMQSDPDRAVQQAVTQAIEKLSRKTAPKPAQQTQKNVSGSQQKPSETLPPSKRQTAPVSATKKSVTKPAAKKSTPR